VNSRSTAHLVVFALVVIAGGDLAFMGYLTLLDKEMPGIFASTFDRVLIALLGVLATSPREAPAAPADVNVVNAPDDPVPVVPPAD
jgi:hypothetical protein